MLPGAPFVVYRGDELFVEGAHCATWRDGTARRCTSIRAAMLSALADYQRATLAGREHLICYAMKANANLAVLQTFAAAGCLRHRLRRRARSRDRRRRRSGCRVLRHGIKTRAETCARGRVMCFNVESLASSTCCPRSPCRGGPHARVSLRVNPDVDRPIPSRPAWGQQVRHRARPGARRLSARRFASRP